jgi:hypothetical protein
MAVAAEVGIFPSSVYHNLTYSLGENKSLCKADSMRADQ